MGGLAKAAVVAAGWLPAVPPRSRVYSGGVGKVAQHGPSARGPKHRREESEPLRGGGGEYAARIGASPPRGGGEPCKRTKANSEPRRRGGVDHAALMELAHRAVAGSSTGRPKRKPTLTPWRGSACCTHWSPPTAPWRGAVPEDRSDENEPPRGGGVQCCRHWSQPTVPWRRSVQADRSTAGGMKGTSARWRG